MREKLIKFDVFTYQISTEKSNLFNLDVSEDYLISNKNRIFADIFIKNLSFYHRRNKLNYKLEYINEDFILLRLANKKIIRIEKEFQQSYAEVEPSCVVAFYNDPNIQLIAIESDHSTFGSSFTVLKILEFGIARALAENNLKFYPQPKYEAKVLWDLFSKYSGRIEKLRFEFSKPNLPRVNQTISEELKSISKNMNSATTKLEFDAPKDNVLENLNEQNKYLADLVQASSEGAGPSKIKIKGLQSWTSTENSVKSFNMDSLEIESNDLNVSKFVSEIKKIMEGE